MQGFLQSYDIVAQQICNEKYRKGIDLLLSLERQTGRLNLQISNMKEYQ